MLLWHFFTMSPVVGNLLLTLSLVKYKNQLKDQIPLEKCAENMIGQFTGRMSAGVYI